MSRRRWWLAAACVGAAACSTVGGAPSSTPDGGNGPRCSAICDDFEGHDLPGPWDNVAIAAPGSLSPTTERYTSPSRSVHVHADDTDAGIARAALTKTVSSHDVTRVTCAFSLYVVALGRLGEGSLVNYTLVSNASSESDEDAFVALVPDPNSTSVVFYEKPRGASPSGRYANYTYIVTSPTALPLGKWIRVRFDVDFAAMRAEATYDGTPLASADLRFPVTKDDGSRIELGYTGFTSLTEPPGPFPKDYFIDDVACDVVP